jgi:excisionase family DNA binding protein
MYTIPVAGRLLRVDEVAHALSVSQHTIRVWMIQGRISFVKLGRCSRISEHELRRLLAEGFRLSQS